MCGRFTLTIVDYGTLAALLGVPARDDHRALYRPRYNVAPTQRHWIVRIAEGARGLEPATFGLVNRWAKDASRAAQQINARVERVEKAPAYREAFRRRRCVVPADGYFEWVGPARARRPVRLHRPDGGLLLLAGLWEDGGPAGERTFSLLTTAARGVPATVHDRMPVMLPAAGVEEWILTDDPGRALRAAVDRGSDPDLLTTEVSTRVNSARHDDAACLEPEPKRTLF